MNKRSVIILAMLFLLAGSIPLRAQWTALQGPPGANVMDLERIPSNGNLLMTTNGKIFRSTDNADSWQEVVVVAPSGLNLDDILVVGTTLYGLNYSQFYKSTDGGINWTKQSTDGAFYGVRRMVRFGPDNFFAIYGWNGIFVSKDEGVTWTKVSSGDAYSVVANAAGDLYTARFVDKTSPALDEAQIIRYLYPGLAGVYNEANWQVVYTNTASPYVYHYNLHVSSAGKFFSTTYNDVLASTTGNSGTWVSTRGASLVDTYFYEVQWAEVGSTISFSNYGTNKVWTTGNAGTSWSSFTAPTSDYGSYVTRFIFGASTATAFMGSSADGILRSTDNGVSWQLKSSGLYFGAGREIEVSATNRIIYINNSQSKGYWTSTNDGVTWTFVPLAKFVSKILKLSDNKILLYGSDNAVYRSDDNGATFPEVEAQYFNSILEDGSGNLIGSAGNSIQKSTDKGTTWAALAPAITGMPASYNVYYTALDNANNRFYFWLYDYGSSSYKLYKAPTTGGAATAITEDPWNDDSNVYANNMFVSNGKLYVAEYNSFYESSDQGVTWKTIGFSGDRVFPITGGLCVSKYGSLYVTQDGGLSWNSTTLPNSNSFIYDITPVTGGFMAATTNSPALKFTGALILPIGQLPPYIDFDWEPTDGPYGGYVYKVFSEGTNSYAFTNSKMYKTTTFASWTTLSHPESEYTNDMLVDKSTNTVYALTGSKVIKSVNGGTSWTDVNTESIDCRNRFYRAPNTDIILYGGCSTPKVYVSTNGGTTFGTEKYTVPANHYLEHIAISSGSGIFLTMYDQTNSTFVFKKSTDRGATWSDVSLPGGITYFYRVINDNNGAIYMMSGLRIFKSTDNTATWTEITGNIASLGGGYLNTGEDPFVLPSGNFAVGGYNSANGGKNGLYKTADNGVTWTFHPTDYWVHAMASVGTRMFAATDNGIFTTDDNCATFTERSTGILGHNVSEIEAINSTKVIALTDNSQVYHSTNSQTWSRLDGFNGRKFMKNPDGSTYAYNSSSIFKTYDNGTSWTKFASYPSSLQHLVTANGTLYFGATYNQIRYTLDFVTWNNLSVSGLPSGFEIQSMAVNGLGSVYIVIYNYSNSKSEMYQILFGSAVRFDKPVTPRNVFYDYDEEVIRLYDGQGVIYQTADGTNWTSKSAPAGDRLIIAQKKYYFIPIYGGVLWLSRNNGQTWQSVGLATFNGNMTFQDVTINEFNGLAYGAISGSVVRKSGNIVLPPETTLPLATQLVPADNSTAISVKPSLSITFDEAVTPMAGKTIRVLDSTNPISPLETIDVTTGVQQDKTITFQMTNVLQFNKSYFVIWDAGAFEDVHGNEIAGLSSTTAWNFTTKTGPAFNSTTPANNGTGVSVQPVLTTTFSEPMLPVAAKNLRVFKTSDATTPVATVPLAAIVSPYATLLPPNPVAGQQVKIRFDATKGLGNLIGINKVFVGSGVVLADVATPTNSDISNFRNAEMTKVPGENNIWEFTLGSSLYGYYGVSAGTPIYKVAFYFHNEGSTIDAVPPSTIVNGTVSNNIVFLNVAAGTTPVCATLISQSGNSLNFNLCTTLEYNTQYFAKFDASSFTTADGGTFSALTGNTDWVFTTGDPPAVTTLTPAHNATGVVNNSTLQVQFASGVTGVAGKKLYINSSTGVQQTLNMEDGVVSGTTLTWTLASALPYGTQFNVTTDAGAFRALNTFSKFQTNAEWVFTTQNSPAISTLTPADDATTATLNTNLVITFASNVTAVASKNLTVHKASDDAVVATLPVNGANINGSTFTFTLPAALLHNTAYYVMVDENAFVGLTAFSKFRNKTDWNFTTIPAPDGTPPTITFTPTNFTKGGTNKLSIVVTDNATGSGVDAASIKVKYRGISVTTEPVSAAMTAGTVANTYEITVVETWMDELGLEFSFEAKDVNGNTANSPATGYHKANIIYPETSSLALPTSVLSFGGGVQNYRIISIPHALGNAEIETVFNEFDMNDHTEIRLLTYNNASSSYDEAPGDFSSFARGVGYWVNIADATSIVLESATTPNNSKESPFVLKLKAGWNQVGNPYPFTISWDAVKTAAANANIGVMKTWNGNSYTTDSKLNAFEGGFVFFNGTGEVNVNIPLSAKTTPGRAAYEPDFGSGWLLPLHVSNGMFDNILGGVGMHPRANLSYDEFDDMPLPAFISMPEVKFPHAEHAMKNFTRDIVPMQNSFVWEFNLDPASAEAVLTWDPNLIAGKANELWLFDESEQKMVNMLTEKQYTVYSGKITKFKVYYGIGQDDIMPTRISLGKPFPNPVVSVSRVNFTLPERNTSPYQVSLDVFDLMGRKVQTLAEGEFSPGFYEAEWTLKGGEASGAGVYFYKLTVINAGDNVVLTQKILLNK